MTAKPLMSFIYVNPAIGLLTAVANGARSF
jgi:hypothetical protein